jgi:hypothetical protein
MRIFGTRLDGTRLREDWDHSSREALRGPGRMCGTRRKSADKVLGMFRFQKRRIRGGKVGHMGVTSLGEFFFKAFKVRITTVLEQPILKVLPFLLNQFHQPLNVPVFI